jgi:hypothetical protein
MNIFCIDHLLLVKIYSFKNSVPISDGIFIILKIFFLNRFSGIYHNNFHLFKKKWAY